MKLESKEPRGQRRVSNQCCNLLFASPPASPGLPGGEHEAKGGDTGQRCPQGPPGQDAEEKALGMRCLSVPAWAMGTVHRSVMGTVPWLHTGMLARGHGHQGHGQGWDGCDGDSSEISAG